MAISQNSLTPIFAMQFRSLSSRIETITYPIPTACVEIIVSKSTGRKSFGGKQTGKNRKHGAKCWPCPGRAFTIFESKTINVRVVLPGNLDIDNFGETRGRSRRRASRCTKKRIAIFSRDRARTPRLSFPISFLFFHIFFGVKRALLASTRIFLSDLGFKTPSSRS